MAWINSQAMSAKFARNWPMVGPLSTAPGAARHRDEGVLGARVAKSFCPGSGGASRLVCPRAMRGGSAEPPTPVARRGVGLAGRQPGGGGRAGGRAGWRAGGDRVERAGWWAVGHHWSRCVACCHSSASSFSSSSDSSFSASPYPSSSELRLQGARLSQTSRRFVFRCGSARVGGASLVPLVLVDKFRFERTFPPSYRCNVPPTRLACLRCRSAHAFPEFGRVRPNAARGLTKHGTIQDLGQLGPNFALFSTISRTNSTKLTKFGQREQISGDSCKQSPKFDPTWFNLAEPRLEFVRI